MNLSWVPGLGLLYYLTIKSGEREILFSLLFFSDLDWYKRIWPCNSHSLATLLLTLHTANAHYVPFVQTDVFWKCPHSKCWSLFPRQCTCTGSLHTIQFQLRRPSTICSFKKSWKPTHLWRSIEMTKRLSWILFTQFQGMADHISIHFPVYAEGNGAKTKTITFFWVLEGRSYCHGKLNLPNAKQQPQLTSLWPVIATQYSVGS